jgi:hypothetical protein
MLIRYRLAIAGLMAALMCAQAGLPLEAGHLGGPRANYGEIVYGRSSVQYDTTFVDGYLAEVAVVGDGDSDLDLYVYDEFGNQIVADRLPSDVCYVSWVPRWTGRFTIVVTNLGSIYNRFTIQTN